MWAMSLMTCVLVAVPTIPCDSQGCVGLSTMIFSGGGEERLCIVSARCSNGTLDYNEP
eukprot:c52276_g1_i1 orf=127-300(+)